MKFSEIFQKKVLNYDTAQYLGNLTYVYIDKCEYNAKYFGVTMHEHISIYAFDNTICGDVILVKEPPIIAEELYPVSIGTEVYDASGNFNGKVTEFFITNFKLSALFVNGCKISISNVLAFGEKNLIIKIRTRLSKANKDREIKSKTIDSVISQNSIDFDISLQIPPSENSTDFDNIISTKYDNQNSTTVDKIGNDKNSINSTEFADKIEETKIVTDETKNVNFENLPINNNVEIFEKNLLEQNNIYKTFAYSETPILYSYKKENPIMINDYNFLIGKRLTRDVYDLTFSFYVKKGAIINSNIVALAKKFGKIVDLAMSINN